ncbi:BZ3500_MvSof-1268-A1-R1_Chr8-1g10025 [Microbotryum saponariae]|uniref:BZ3500_MvSof-1268-A1-R1_Chr8-1g10025 protein n=1 Tax=Microbotryum saponariae TaxID=289078 RepID=A0A2X0LB21_9BASI|nr:BZ3500_MvSof-1268-A1-R1_Chr8-1g10025 [Microbotryum saponariae]SDA08311.1 BZ3501_MvSof-1269-A2-R1_Chr8-1g09748 [Microbotryum saponariae]
MATVVERMDTSSDSASELSSGSSESGSDLEIIDCRPATSALEVLAITDDDHTTTTTTTTSSSSDRGSDAGSDDDLTIVAPCPKHSPMALKTLTLAKRSGRASPPPASTSNTATPTSARDASPHPTSTASTASTASTLQRKSLQKQAEARPAGYLVISSDEDGGDDDDEDSSDSNDSELEITVVSRSSPKRAPAVVVPPAPRHESSGDDLPAPQGIQNLTSFTPSAPPSLSTSIPRKGLVEDQPSNQGSIVASTSQVQIEQLLPLSDVPPPVPRLPSVGPSQHVLPHPPVSKSRLFIPKSKPSSSSLSWKARPNPTRLNTIRVNLSSSLLKSGDEGWVKAIPRRLNAPEDRLSRLPQSPPTQSETFPTGPVRHPSQSPPKQDATRLSPMRSPTRAASALPQQAQTRRSNDLGLNSDTDSSEDDLPAPFGSPSKKLPGKEDVAAALPTPAATISPSLASDSSLTVDKGKARASEWTDPDSDREMEADDEGESPVFSMHRITPDHCPAFPQRSPGRPSHPNLTGEPSTSAAQTAKTAHSSTRAADLFAPTPKQGKINRTKKSPNLFESSSSPPMSTLVDQNPTPDSTPESKAEAEAPRPPSEPSAPPGCPDSIQAIDQKWDEMEQEEPAVATQVDSTVPAGSQVAAHLHPDPTSAQPELTRRAEAQRLRRERERAQHAIEARMTRTDKISDAEVPLDPASIEGRSALNLTIVKKRRLVGKKDELKLGTRERRKSKRVIKAPLQTLPNGLMEVDMKVDHEVLAQVEDVNQFVREVNKEVAQVNEEIDSLQERFEKFVLLESARPPKERQILGPELEDEKKSDVRATLIQLILNARAFEMQTGEKADKNPRYDTSSHTLLFESLIADVNSSELSAPCRIRVIPPVDGGKPHSPPFEFVYTNRVILPQGSAPEAPSSCDCEGNCGDPANLKRCACRQRQREASRTIGTENERSGHDSFAWEPDGTLNHEVFGCSDPIWECNAGCGCDDTCVNHVVGKKRSVDVDIFWTGPMKGWGVRNPPSHDLDPQSSMPFMPDGGSVYRGRVIRRGESLAIYAGEQIPTSNTPERVEVYDKLCRNYIYDLDHFHIPEEAGKDHLYRTQGRKPLSGNATKKAQKYGRDLAAFAVQYRERVWNKELGYCVDAFLRGNWTRFCNHSCSEFNAISRPVYVDEGRVERPLLVLFASRDIQPGEEIRISYHSESSPEFKQAPNQTRAQYKTLLRQYRAKANARRMRARPEFRCYCKLSRLWRSVYEDVPMLTR